MIKSTERHESVICAYGEFEEEQKVSKTLVAYFSTGGNTRRAAKAVADAAGAELYEIRPVEPYTHTDRNWMDRNSRSTKESNDPDARPEIVHPLPELDGVETLLLGFPIWWYTCPAVIRTFLESVDTSGMRIVPFATSGGSGLGNVEADLQKYAPNAQVGSGRMLNGRLDRAAIRSWLEDSGVI